MITLKGKPGGYSIADTYKGFKIVISNNNFRFGIIGLTSEGKDVSFDCESFDTAREAVDRHLASEARTKKEKLSLPVLSDDGTAVTIVGVHGGHFGIITQPTNRGALRAFYYPPVPWIADGLRQVKALHAQIDNIQAAINHYRIEHNAREFTRNANDKSVDDDMHEEAVALLKLQVNGKTKAAKKTASLHSAMRKHPSKKIRT